MSERNPFVGPRPIQRGEALYGRDAEVRELYNRLQARRIVVLHSPSGAGKSSLVQAGLIPRLLEGGYDVWRPIRLNLDPGGVMDVPVGTNRFLLSALVSLEDELPSELRRSPAALASLDLLTYVKSRPRRRGRQERPTVLVFDQFEEVLTVAPLAVADRREFFTALGQLLDSEACWALFAIREDHLAALAPYRDRIPTELSNTFRLDLLGLAGAREAAKQLAAQGGRSFPAVDHLIRDLSVVQVQQTDGSFAAGPGLYVEPVQLQVVCRRLWDAMPADDLSIDPEDLEAYASVSSALGSYYAEAVHAIAGDDVAVERAIREWFGNQLIVGGIRSQVRQEARTTAGLDNALIRRLLDSFLVRSEQRAGVHWFELSHDRLTEPIQLDNNVWEAEHLHPLQVQARLWKDRQRDAALLLGAEALRSARIWAHANPTLLTKSEREFLDLSDVQRARERTERRRLVLLAAVAVAVAVAVGVLAVVALAARQEAVAAVGAVAKQRDVAQKAEGAARQAAAEALAQKNTAEKATNAALQSKQDAEASAQTAVAAKKANEKLLQDMFRAALRGLIESLAQDGSLSGEVVVDKRWTPLLEREQQCFAAATVVEGRGRIVVAGHDAVLSVANRRGYSVFLEMTSKWLLGDQNQPYIVILADASAGKSQTVHKLEDNLTSLGYKHKTNPPLEELDKAGLLIIANRHQSFTQKETAFIKDFIDRDGGILAVGVGWSWLEQRTVKGRKPAITGYPMNQLFHEFGAQWNASKIQGLEKPPEPRVVLFEHQNFEGRSQSFGVGRHNAHTLGRVGEDQVASVKVGLGLRVTLWEDPGFQGNRLVLSTDSNDLEKFSGLCSALEVERIPLNEKRTLLLEHPELVDPASTGKVIVYENANFTGGSMEFDIGKYDQAALGLGNDKISSVRVPTHLQVKLYDNPGFKGEMVNLRFDEQSLVALNNRTSSIEVEKRDNDYTFKGLYFDLDKDTIKPKSKPLLDRIISQMKEFNEVRVSVTCHEDNTGSPDYKIDLTRRRAESVKRYLIDHGIDGNRIEIRWAGSGNPIATNTTAAGRAKNRRCELEAIVP